ncbi:alpha/beta fold hydrolase [Marinobacterium stanieri]|uniref:Pimeloyl-ACP methyl ester carboxylesterase n=1 Tax=Marinobacterium stanieri TaxID=49186 RepID=A0A1N6SXJ8_9GAMM|nr:alpha/beta hydrolase [Marinobacterium stanieri]SIQ45772.1 Pimeloyl-ACP methyl ester carboxylesterase [Marinobacterium stanieri]
MNCKTDLDTDQHRRVLREKLGISHLLAQRQCADIGDVPLHTEYYFHADDAPLLVFVPGIGTYSELYADLLSRFSKLGFNVVGLDLRGHGYSGGPRGLYTVEQSVSDIQAVIDHYQASPEQPVYLYGYSIGALLAVAAAEADARIQAVVCGTLLVPALAPDMVHHLGWSWIWGSALLMPGVALPMQSFIDYEQLLAGHPAGEEINADPRVVFDYPLGTLSSLFTCHLGSLTRRYPFRGLIVHGDRDEVLPLSYSQRVQATLTQPFELEAVPGEGHMLPWDRPGLLAHLIADWLHAGAVTKA